jgi:hypothetical protein
MASKRKSKALQVKADPIITAPIVDKDLADCDAALASLNAMLLRTAISFTGNPAMGQLLIACHNADFANPLVDTFREDVAATLIKAIEAVHALRCHCED